MPRVATTAPSSPVRRLVDRSFGVPGNESPRITPSAPTPAPPPSPVALPRGIVPPAGAIPPSHHVQFFATPVVMVPAGTTPYQLFPPAGLSLSSSLGMRQPQRTARDAKQQYWGKTTTGMMGNGMGMGMTTPKKPRLDWKSISPRTPESDEAEKAKENSAGSSRTCFDDGEGKEMVKGGGGDEKGGEARGYFPFYSRRIQSKSEPSGSGQGGGSRSPTF
ncbi:hypothetical protein QBC36DRAFT_320822 [Triangularia setosa]|uniref:Uncharacterized protein n=1 Tax=Triangularia setosa TaxID=2587417 RepID=A0AAN6WE39_9PEZI|nr:hypothetical protein QBC36DRAFT_320822 [Podospora setosa]